MRSEIPGHRSPKIIRAVWRVWLSPLLPLEPFVGKNPIAERGCDLVSNNGFERWRPDVNFAAAMVCRPVYGTCRNFRLITGSQGLGFSAQPTFHPFKLWRIDSR